MSNQYWTNAWAPSAVCCFASSGITGGVGVGVALGDAEGDAEVVIDAVGVRDGEALGVEDEQALSPNSTATPTAITLRTTGP